MIKIEHFHTHHLKKRELELLKEFIHRALKGTLLLDKSGEHTEHRNSSMNFILSEEVDFLSTLITLLTICNQKKLSRFLLIFLFISVPFGGGFLDFFFRFYGVPRESQREFGKLKSTLTIGDSQHNRTAFEHFKENSKNKAGGKLRHFASCTRRRVQHFGSTLIKYLFVTSRLAHLPSTSQCQTLRMRAPERWPR